MLTCAHCNCKFEGSSSQARHVKYEKTAVYCSGACRAAAMQSKFRVSPPNRVCMACGKEFFSKTAKKYCNFTCYSKSVEMAKLLENNRKELEKRRGRGINVSCMECGKIFYQKKAAKGRAAKKFCNRACYRAYMSARFDRHIANPESLALPQCYDEFLDQELLRCPFDECDWVGKNLSMHVNMAHGIKQRDFKKAAGFNLCTGIVSKDLAENMRRRNNKERLPGSREALVLARTALKNKKEIYISLERVEHLAKTRAISGPGPARICVYCGIEFTQTTKYGRTLYCSKKCRDSLYCVRRSSKSREVKA